MHIFFHRCYVNRKFRKCSRFVAKCLVKGKSSRRMHNFYFASSHSSLSGWKGAIMSEPIAAVATGPAPSAIGVLRLSGDGVIPLADRLFHSVRGVTLQESESRRLIFGSLLDGEGRVLDQVLATVSRAPHSYTGEDTVEFQCHGSPAVLALGMEALCALGVRPAGPGEFTRRAFLNGKLDLTAAEAVMDLIDAETEEAVHQAAGQLSGALCRRVDAVYDALVDVMAHFHAVLDYPDEDIDPFTQKELESALDAQSAALSALLDTYGQGRLISSGAACAIVGRPNAGKSSLLNALLGYERAIVTPVAGTTRDTVEERLRLGGVLLRLIDTAGLRDTSDEAERQGVARSRSAAQQAELVLAVVDASRPLEEEDLAALALAQSAPRGILVLNKSDRPALLGKEELSARFSLPAVSLSALTGDGISELQQLVSSLFPREDAALSGEWLTNARQADAARRALRSLSDARSGLASGFTPDAVLTDVEAALSALGELTGKTLRSDITDRIFSRFCVGK